MANPTLLERLQPALLDRLADDVTAIAGDLARRRAELGERLDPEQCAALDRLLARDDLAARRLDQQLAPTLAGLEGDLRRRLAELVALEEARRFEVTRSAMLSMRELRALVLRDLEALLNSESLEGFLGSEGGEPVGLFEGLPAARASVVNYGIPALAGKVHTRADCEILARGIATAIDRFEPRLRAVEVLPEAMPEDPGAPVSSPASFLVRGELWGYPLPEALRLRTVLDLEEGRATIRVADEAG